MAVIIVMFEKQNDVPKVDAKRLTNMILDNHDVSLANNGIVSENQLKKIQSIDYNDFKKSLNIDNDFCLYIEDENGNIILSKGSSKLNANGLPCKE